MSLFVGNLSARIQPEDLEHVFQRFGRCSVRMKDGYGFVVFEDPVNAEKALRALRGNLICGEKLILSWSNKQPRPVQRNNRFHERYPGRNFREGEVSMNRSSRARRDFMKHSEGNRGISHLESYRDKEVGYAHENIDGITNRKGLNLSDKVQDVQENVENPVENGRWGEPVGNSLDGNAMTNLSDFERYEPNRDYDGKDIDEGRRTSGSYGSPARAKSMEKRGNSSDVHAKHIDNLRKQPLCYNCGLLGHMMRNCPRGSSSRLENSSRFRSRKANDINFRGKSEGQHRRIRNISRGRLASGRDAFSSGRDILRYSREFQAGDRKMSFRRREILEDAEGNTQFKPNLESQRKRSKREHESSRKRIKKKNRRSRSSSLHSSSTRTSSTSHSPSRSDLSKIRSRSGSSMLSKSPAKSPRSISVSPSSRSRSPRSRSRSRSILSRSLSVSLDTKSVSSLENVRKKFAKSPSPKRSPEHMSILKVDNKTPAYDDPDIRGAVDVDMIGTSVKAPGGIHSDDLDKAKFPFDNMGNVETHVSDSREHVLEKLTEKSEERIESGVALYAKPNMKFVEGCQLAHKSRRISSQEMCSVLKHYGLEMPDQCEQDLTVEMYFGAARLWPWEMIYYRRLKKGPISTENYAKRLQQNKEFGIVDKYIRSSSGWDGCDHNNM